MLSRERELGISLDAVLYFSRTHCRWGGIPSRPVLCHKELPFPRWALLRHRGGRSV